MSVIRLLLCCAFLAAGCAAPHAREIGRSSEVLSFERTSLDESGRLYLHFVFKMISWRQHAPPDAGEYAFRGSFLAAGEVAQAELWTWTADNGNAVRRMDDGTFRVVEGACLTSFCRSSDCRQLAWPTFACTDDRKRTMSAPDMSTMVFDGIRYRRLK